jgi:hypothetical protein
MKKLLILFCLVGFAAIADVDEKASTNLLITSDAVEIKGWSRRHVMADKDNNPINDDGKLVAYIDAIAQSATAGEIEKQAVVISNAMMEAVGRLSDVTNQIPSKSSHIALYLPRLQAAQNLAGEVVWESSDGVTDTQRVRYNQRLMLAPNRSVEYVYNDVTTRVACVWSGIWDTNALEHVCTIKRPVNVRNIRALTYRHEKFGGLNGFDFGSALVTVDGVPTFTGSVTNQVTGEVLDFRNGINQAKAKEINE